MTIMLLTLQEVTSWAFNYSKILMHELDNLMRIIILNLFVKTQ